MLTNTEMQGLQVMLFWLCHLQIDIIANWYIRIYFSYSLCLEKLLLLLHKVLSPSLDYHQYLPTLGRAIFYQRHVYCFDCTTVDYIKTLDVFSKHVYMSIAVECR